LNIDKRILTDENLQKIRALNNPHVDVLLRNM